MNPLRIAERVRRIKPSPSAAAADRASELRRQGKRIVNLVVGEPDFDTPEHIRQAAARAMEAGATRYTPMKGTIELRQAIAAKLQRENGLSYDTDEIIVTNGAKSAIYSALSATVEPGDEVIIPAPYWVSYPDMVLACERPRDHRLRGESRLQACAGATGRGHHRKDALAAAELSEQSDRRQLFGGRVPRSRRRAGSAPACARRHR
jgi:histidinol-phosphate/aromatic aminotransferase/cobyric acid decarboxylase-like protein